MQAVLVRELNGKVSLEEVQLGDPGPGHVKVKIAAAGVCHSDISVLNGTLPLPLPTLIGHEGAGIVTAIGEGVTSVTVGDHVILNWMPFCGRCPACRRGETQACPNGFGLSLPHTSIDGAPVFPMAGTGTFAEEAVVHESSAIPIPDDVPLDVAALIGCGVMTGVGAAMNAAKVEPGSTVVVIGSGGVGINVIQGAKICGAAVIVAVDRFKEKAEDAKRFGATHAATPEELAALQAEVTGGEGFDYAFEVIGTPATIRAAFDASRRGGTTVVVGVGRLDEAVSFSPFELVFKEPRIIGTVYGSANVRRDFPKMIALWKAGKLDLEGLISRRIALSEVGDAFEAMERGEVIRQVITID